jgi:hypothetical protein
LLFAINAMTATNKNGRCLFLMLAAGCLPFSACFYFPNLNAVRIGKHNNDHKKTSSYNDNIDELTPEESAKIDDLPTNTRQSVPNNASPPLDIGKAMQLMGTSPRRVFTSVTASTAIALVANLFGVTSNILSELPEEFSDQSGLDYIYPRDGFKRVAARSSIGGVGKCSFLIPKDWVADTGLALAQAQRQARALDLSMNSNAREGVLPDAAFGPPGRLDSQGLSNGDTNVSVIINAGVKNFILRESLGEPSTAAEKLISARFRRPTTVLTKKEIQRGESTVYQFEYIVDRGDKYLPLRAISVIGGGVGGSSYITLTVVSPSPEWDKPAVNQKLRKIVDSLKLM